MRTAIAFLTLCSSFLISPHSAPASEPNSNPYSFLPSPDTFAQRRQQFLDLTAQSPGNGPYSEAARIAAGHPPQQPCLQRALDAIDQRRDCSDFRLNGFLRLLYQFRENPLLPNPLQDRIRQSILNYKYWPDEPGVDSMCTWSENHHIMFAAAGYLAGQLFPDDTFTNSGQTGRQKMAISRPRVLRWLDLRFRTGFSEWLSNVYYNEDLPPLVNLVDFAQDPEIAQRAAMVADLILADIALNSFHGHFGSTHGRTYEREKKHAAAEHVGSAQRLLFGMNQFDPGNMTATCLALSPNYRMPPVLYDIATDFDPPEMINTQRMGIRVKDAKKWGLHYNTLEDGMTFLSLEAYAHPKTINLTMRMFDQYNWWQNSFFEPFAQHRNLIDTARAFHLLPLIACCFRHDLQRNLRDEVNIYTYRTPDYMLSTAQDYRRGYGGDQQHIWQATLGPGAVCFTTHPAQTRPNKTPNYWEGSGSLPRAAQVGNVAIALYRIRTTPGLYLTHKLLFTHAWLPKDKFDEVIEQNGWVFARLGDGYLALWSQQPCYWQTEEGDDKDRELIADGRENIWLCQLGRRATDGTFPEFIQHVSTAPITTNGLNIQYQSPSQGHLQFGWYGPLRQNGKPVKLHDYPRYQNPYCTAPFPGNEITFQYGDHRLHLNWSTLERHTNKNYK